MIDLLKRTILLADIDFDNIIVKVQYRKNPSFCKITANHYQKTANSTILPTQIPIQ